MKKLVTYHVTPLPLKIADFGRWQLRVGRHATDVRPVNREQTLSSLDQRNDTSSRQTGSIRRLATREDNLDYMELRETFSKHAHDRLTKQAQSNYLYGAPP